MKFSPISQIVTRIQWAHRESPIAVFRGKIDKLEGIYAVFARTVQTAARIRDEDPDLVGVFFRGTPTKEVYSALTNALK
jgi:hypothetical protein